MVTLSYKKTKPVPHEEIVYIKETLKISKISVVFVLPTCCYLYILMPLLYTFY